MSRVKGFRGVRSEDPVRAWRETSVGFGVLTIPLHRVELEIARITSIAACTVDIDDASPWGRPGRCRDLMQLIADVAHQAAVRR
jgi:hypothetical protein